MRKLIEFQTHTPGELSLIQAMPESHIPFRDLVLKPDYTGFKYSIPRGSSVFRVLPAITENKQWMMQIDAISHAHGRHANPKNIEPSAVCVFDLARKWMSKNRPELVYSNKNPSGFKLWASKVAACWVIVGDSDHYSLGILLTSAFAGSKENSNTGLGYQIQKLVSQNPELLDADAGYQIKATRSFSPGSKIPQTELTVCQSEKTLNEALGELSAEDLNLICPIGDTIRQVSVDLEWVLLAATIGQDLTDKIRAAYTTA